jgi:hypothetical protein
MSRLFFWIYTVRLLLRGSRLINQDGKYIIINFYDYGDCYMASASTSSCSVLNCYGSTKEKAQEMAMYKLKQALEEIKPPTH